MIAEIAGGLWSGSLALISDASHMATDVVGIAIAIVAIRIARRPPDVRRTYGYDRFEILAAFANAIVLFGVAIFILVEAWRRLREPPEVHTPIMFVIAAVGLAVNVFAMKVLAPGKDASLNLKGAYLEVWSDLLSSIGVMAAALAIWMTGTKWIDSIVAVAIGFWVLPRTWALFSESLNVLLDGAPAGLDVRELKTALSALPSVEGVHDLHVWSLSSGKICMSVHAVVPSFNTNAERVAESMRLLAAERFHIKHATIQVESKPCSDAKNGHDFL